MSGGVRYVRIMPDDSDPQIRFPDLQNFAPFKAIIVIDEPCGTEFRKAAARWLVDSGCLYAMSWGHECSLWDEAIDYVNLGDVPDDRFVMTTWHEDEPLPEVFWFASHAAVHEREELENILISALKIEGNLDHFTVASGMLFTAAAVLGLEIWATIRWYQAKTGGLADG